MTNAGGYENADVLFGQVFMEFAAVNQDIHGVSHAETVPKVMKRVVSVVFLHTELEPNFINGFTFLEIAMDGFHRRHTSQKVRSWNFEKSLVFNLIHQEVCLQCTLYLKF